MPRHHACTPQDGRMSEWLQHPAFQAGVAPLVVAFVVGFALRDTRYAWLAIVAGLRRRSWRRRRLHVRPAHRVAQGAAARARGAARRDRAGCRRGRAARPSRSSRSSFGASSLWVFQSVLAQRTTQEVVLMGGGMALFVAVLVALLLRLRGDGLRTGATGVGLGLALGIAALLSASIGYFMAGIAIAAAAGAMMLVQLARREPVAAGRARRAVDRRRPSGSAPRRRSCWRSSRGTRCPRCSSYRPPCSSVGRPRAASGAARSS